MVRPSDPVANAGGSRVCPGCDGYLASDNAGPLCSPCQSAGRAEPAGPAEVPPDFWESPDMRAALAARHMGQVMRAYREHTHHGRKAVTQDQLAVWSGRSQPWICQIENGPPINQLDRLIAWAELLRIPQKHLWFALPGRDGAGLGVESLPDDDDPCPVPHGTSLVASDVYTPIGDTPNGDHEGALSMAEDRARNFGRRFGANGLNDATLQQLHEDVARLAFDYQRRPVTDLLGDLTSTQDAVFSSLEQGQPPTQARHLFFLGGIVSGVLAKASHDFQNPSGAMVHTRTGFLCADQADHDGLRAWLRGLQSQISYWAGRPREALRYAQQGAAFAARSTSSMSVWLPACEARAWAMLGNSDEAIAAVQRAETALDAIRPDDLDEIGGLCSFGPTRQLYYAADALVWLTDEAEQAETYANRAVAAYQDADSPDWAFGDQAGSHTNLAVTRILRAERDGAAEALQPVLDLPAELRINGIVNSARRVHEALRRSALGTDTTELQEQIEAFTRTPLPALPAGGG